MRLANFFEGNGDSRMIFGPQLGKAFRDRWKIL